MLMELAEMITTAEAVEIAEKFGTPITRFGVVKAIKRGEEGEESGIPGGVQLGGEYGQWLIPRKNFIEWLETRRPRGSKTQN